MRGCPGDPPQLACELRGGEGARARAPASRGQDPHETTWAGLRQAKTGIDDAEGKT